MSITSKATNKAVSLKDVMIENKRQSIKIIILFVVWLVILIGTMIGGKVISDEDKFIVDETARCGREIAAMRANDNTFTSVHTKDDSVIEYSGTQIDAVKWQKDDELFVDFIRPAFEFNDGQEYMTNRYNFIVQLGEGNKFTTLVMGALEAYAPTDAEVANGDAASTDMIYFIPGSAAKDVNGNVTAVTASNACANVKSSLSSDWFKSYPISILSEDGSYSYIAVMNVSGPGSTGNSGRIKYIAKYTITTSSSECDQANCSQKGEHSHLLDFECWPLF